ncbi:MarR family winged helix-turn-helix transcriptional regulator [Microbacterium sp. ZW T5_56]|uniref:MarR family winged helix-turn-helix transcriptional regulator n=1 Tax=Microbacterium sp. ZW T5_56 TaxID=3378081 RepID=UPI0038548DBB
MSGLETRFAEADASPGFLLWQATNAWQRRVRAALAPHDLTHVQFVLLATLLSLQPAPVTQRQLADAAGTDAMMTSQVLRGLEKRSLITRLPHPTDRRAVIVAVTDQAVPLVNAANRAVEDADERFFSALEPTHLDHFVRLLRELHTS